MKYQILTGNNCDVLKQFPDNHFDSIVTDPPYRIDFLGKAWDANTGALETYQECLRVLKPGGHILAFSAARTYHHLAITLEQAGFEIRDQIMWIYSSGFPKSQDIGKSIERSDGKKKKKVVADRYEGSNEVIEGSFGSGHGKCSKCKKDVVAARILGQRQACPEDGCEYNEMYKPADNAWAGWGTALKPAHEPIALARKPIKLSIARNCQVHGVGALNIDATRVPYENDYDAKHQEDIARGQENATNGTNFFGNGKSKSNKPTAGKRTASFHTATGGGETQSGGDGSPQFVANEQGRFPSNVIGEIPDYQKYFYCPKVSRKERHIGFDQLPDSEPLNSPDQVRNHPLWDPSIGTNAHRLKEKIRTEEAKLETHDINVMGKTPMCLDCNKTFNGTNDHGACDPSKKAFVEKRKPTIVGNNHPTVKPIELMKYLIKLITPPGGTVLDPFNGSGSTGCAAVELGHPYIGCELDLKYVDIARKRIQAWYEHTHPTDPLVASGLFEQC